MRSTLLTLALLSGLASVAQYDSPADPATLPVWMQEVAFGTKPVRTTLPDRAPLHTNAFTGTWSVQKEGGRRFDFWSDKHRVVVQDIDQKGTLRRMYFIDLAANIRMAAGSANGTVHFMVDDMHIPQAGYFREIWSERVEPAGRAEVILGEVCQEVVGIDGNNDTTYYWRTRQHPDLFADMRVWAPWLCREGELEYLTALTDAPAGASMRARWGQRGYSTPAGSIAVLSITPGAAPMPTIEGRRGHVIERRFLWNNNSGIGRLPAWMRAYVSHLKPDALPVAFTPAPVQRAIPDNKFIGTLTAETPSMTLGFADKDGRRDTTHQLTKYSYWADARRAVLIMDDPDDEGYLFYAVDLDHDVVMAAHNELHSYVIPRLYISTLQQVGLKEFGRGLDMPMTATGQYRTILGHKCELHTTSERFLSHFFIPTKPVLNPVFDMRNWMLQRMGQKMKDLLFFGVADKPMPMAVMGTHLTSYKRGKAKPPVADLRYYRVYDERLERDRGPQEQVIEERIMSMEDVMHTTVPEPVIEASPDIEPPRGPDEERVRRRDDADLEMLMPAHEPKPVMLDAGPEGDGHRPPPKRAVEGTRQPTAGSGTGEGRADRAKLDPYMESVMARSTNHFIGTALLEYTLTNSQGETRTWTVHYASDSTRMVVIGRSADPLPNGITRTYLIDRRSVTETVYVLLADSTVNQGTQPLKPHFTSVFPPAHADSLLTGTKKILGRTCAKHLYEIPTTRRASWVDPATPSLFQDVVGARKKWGGIEVLLLGNMITSTAPGMPLEVDYTYHGGDHLVMKVLELRPGPVDLKVFDITKDSWKGWASHGTH